LQVQSLMISPDSIEDVRNRMDIVDVISDFITLKRSGQNYKALSPFNSENTPSFYVVPSKGIFKDFSSGKGGDAITFVMEHEGMSYIEAIRYLAKKYGVELKETVQTQLEQEAVSSRDSLYIVMNYAKEQFKTQLLESEEGKSIGLSYFRERGFHDRTIEKFELGYTQNEWRTLYDAALKAGYSEDVLEKAGLIVKKEEGKTYDRFRGRVIFPVHNLAGKVIAFGARILTNQKDQPKYINSPETEIYHKSEVLYGIYQAKNAIRKEDFCFLVEGYTDVISLHQAGIENAVASSGTALTEDQIKLIKRFTENVTVLFDGDAAGIRAALRGIDLILKGGLNVRVLLLPDGEDPDSFSRKHSTTELTDFFKKQAKDFISFKIDLYASEAAQDPVKKAEAIREIITSISVIPDPIKRSVYIQETSNLLKIQETVLLTELNKILIAERRKSQQEKLNVEKQESFTDRQDILSPAKLDSNGIVEILEREVIRMLLVYSNSKVEEDVDLVSYFINEFEDLEFSNKLLEKIFNIYLEAKEKGLQLNSDYFFASEDNELKNLVAEIVVANDRYHISPNWKNYNILIDEEKDNVPATAHHNVLFRKYRYVQKLIEENIIKIKEAEARQDLSEVDQLLMVQIQLKNFDSEIAKQLGITSGKY
jgi:DNA primase